MLDASQGFSCPNQNFSADCHSIAIIDDRRVLLSEPVADSFALAILSVVSDDPNSFDEMIRLWPRYRTHAFPERLDSVSLVVANREQLQEVLFSDPFFIVIDLDKKRVLTGPRHHPLESQMTVSRNPKIDDEEEPISFHLPPWWLLSENSDPEEVLTGENNAVVPSTDREFLYGRPMAQAIARELFRAFVSYHATNCDFKSSDLKSLDPASPTVSRQSCQPAPGIVPYDVSIRIHRQWLMTPHPKLGGRYPRQLLHGGRDWIDAVAMAQQRRYLNGLPMVAVPADLRSVQYAPMGLPEMSTYFDICRHAIASGWATLYRQFNAHEIALHDIIFPCDIDGLASSILDSINQWTEEIPDDGISPRFIIESDRRRVPLGGQLKIVGMDPPQPDPHPTACDCNLCEMLQSGILGPSFEFFDGHHLEVDDEFAFSMFETRSEWEFNRWSCDDDDCEETSSEYEESLDDPDTFIQLAQALTEIVFELQVREPTDVMALEINKAYVKYRTSTADRVDRLAESLSMHLRRVAERYPELKQETDQCLQALEDTIDMRTRTPQPAV